MDLIHPLQHTPPTMRNKHQATRTNHRYGTFSYLWEPTKKTSASGGTFLDVHLYQNLSLGSSRWHVRDLSTFRTHALQRISRVLCNPQYVCHIRKTGTLEWINRWDVVFYLFLKTHNSSLSISIGGQLDIIELTSPYLLGY
jgi:hypothetical protein